MDSKMSYEYDKSEIEATPGSETFAIYRDLWKASDIKIHRIDCGMYVNRVPTATVTWDYAQNHEDAENIARDFSKKDGIKYRECILCNPSQPVLEI